VTITLTKFKRAIYIGSLALLPLMAAPAASAATIAQGGQSHQNVQASPHVMDPVWFKWSAYLSYDVCVEHGQLLVNFPSITTFQCVLGAQMRGLPQIWDLWLYGYPDSV